MELFTPAALPRPIVAAPMAGGPSTPELVAAVSGAGGLGFLAGGYRDVDAVRGDVARLRVLGEGRPFGVNLFAPPGRRAGAGLVDDYARELAGEAQLAGVALGEPRWDDDSYRAKLRLLVDEQPPVVSFTFGCPAAGDVAALRAVGSSVWITVTTAEEAGTAAAAGADALVVQGVEAGGHRGGFDDAHPGDLGLLALLQLVRAATDDRLPLVASGGIATGAGVAAVLAAGAVAAQLGTAFLLCPESGTAPAHRAVLAERDRPTALTRAFTGRTARGLVNRFLREYTATAPSAYPEVHHLTAPVRATARERGDVDGFHLWAGQAYALTTSMPAAELVAHLCAEAADAAVAAARRLSLDRS